MQSQRNPRRPLLVGTARGVGGDGRFAVWVGATLERFAGDRPDFLIADGRNAVAVVSAGSVAAVELEPDELVRVTMALARHQRAHGGRMWGA